MLGTPFGGTKHSGYGREHAIQTWQGTRLHQDDPLPSGTGAVPAWRGVTEIFDRAS
jgi:hypothetical protein